MCRRQILRVRWEMTKSLCQPYLGRITVLLKSLELTAFLGNILCSKRSTHPFVLALFKLIKCVGGVCRVQTPQCTHLP